MSYIHDIDGNCERSPKNLSLSRMIVKSYLLFMASSRWASVICSEPYSGGSSSGSRG
jgi:hypothetical protein